jgi:hypothetical protein
MNNSSVQAHILAQTVGIFNWRQEFELSRIIEFHGPDMEATRIKMVKAIEAYRAARPRLKWAYMTPIKFFQSDIWSDPDSWPWLAQQRPSGASCGMYTPATQDEIDEANRKHDIRPTDEIDAANALCTWRGAVGTDLEDSIPKWIREELGMEGRDAIH